MYVTVCPWCKSKFYRATEEISTLHRECGYKKVNDIKERPLRTSTPVPQPENVTSSFSDSVLDFFYQTWKNGLLSEKTKSPVTWKQFEQAKVNEAQYLNAFPFWYSSSQAFYVTTMVCQSVMPATSTYFQLVGYRPDGTFGVLPLYWPCILQ